MTASARETWTFARRLDRIERVSTATLQLVATYIDVPEYADSLFATCVPPASYTHEHVEALVELATVSERLTARELQLAAANDSIRALQARIVALTKGITFVGVTTLDEEFAETGSDTPPTGSSTPGRSPDLPSSGLGQ